MQYELSLGAFFTGLIILVIGAVCVRYYQWIADNFGGGVGSYEKYRLYAIIACALGIIVMINLHTFILDLLIGGLFRR